MMVQLGPEELLYIHYRLIERIGGRHGVREIRPLQEALERVNGSRRGVGEKPCDKAASLLHSLIYEYPFVDGNKATAFTAALLLLHLHGYSISIGAEEAKDLAARVAAGQFGVRDTAKWLSERVGKGAG